MFLFFIFLQAYRLQQRLEVERQPGVPRGIALPAPSLMRGVVLTWS